MKSLMGQKLIGIQVSGIFNDAKKAGMNYIELEIQNTETGEVTQVIAVGEVTDFEMFRNEYIDAAYSVQAIRDAAGVLRDVNVLENITVIEKVVAVDAVENMKLYTTENQHTDASIGIDDLVEGGMYTAVVLYCQSAEIKVGKAGKYRVFNCLDKDRRFVKVFEHRIYDDEKNAYRCKYLCFDVAVTNGFVNSVGAITEYEKAAVKCDSDIEIAETYLKAITSEDEELTSLLNRLTYFDTMKERQYEIDAAKGFGLVKLAKAVYLAHEMVNVSPIVDIKLLIRALFARTFYQLTFSENTTKSHVLVNFQYLCRDAAGKGRALAVDLKLISCIDTDDIQYKIVEKKLVPLLEQMADTLIEHQYTMVGRDDKNKVWKGGK